MNRIIQVLVLVVTAQRSRSHNERGEGAVPWLIVLGFGVAIAVVAGDAVWAFANDLIGDLGGR